MGDLEASELLAAARSGLAQGSDAPAGEVTARARVWRAGLVLGEAEASGADALTAAANAGAAASAACGDETLESGVSLSIEVEAEREAQSPHGLNELLQVPLLGRHGMILRDGEREARGWPFDPLRKEGRLSAWVKRLNREARPPGARLASSTSVERFTTVEAMGLAAPPDEERITARVGGFRVVDLDEVLPDRLTGSALQAAAWLLRHQRADGSFVYEYSPREQAWSPFDQLVRQAGCTWSVALVGRLTRDRGTLQAATRAVQGILQRHLRRDGPGRLFYLEDMYGEPKLGAIPLLLLAILELRGTARFERETVDQLTAALLAVQSRDGRFGTTARGLELEGSETYYAGQVALALARIYAPRPRPRLRTAVERSLRHYHERWSDEDERDLSFTTWMLQACDQWHALTDDESSREYAYEMVDWALEEQHSAEHEHPLWPGAFQNTPGIGTAAYSEGLASALAIAQRAGDEDRAKRYQQALLLAMRFLLQLTVEASEVALVGGTDQIGAVRSALHRDSLRCDNAQHFIMASLRARALCWPNE